MSYDNLCKLMAEKNPERFAEWILGEKPRAVKVLKSELSIEPIRADSIIFLEADGRILHLEFQTVWESNPPVPLRMLDYFVRLHRLYRLPIVQVVVLLLPPGENTVIETAFIADHTRHNFQVLRLWEQPAELFLADPILLPFATLTATPSPEALLTQVAQRIDTIKVSQQQREISSYAQLLAGLKFQKSMIKRIFREGMMRESVIFQEILQEGEEKGRQEGLQEGRQETAINLLRERISVELIMRATGLTQAQVKQLRQQLDSETEA
jgi:predicted transposase/invertase (TIGR01784 family)